MPPRIEQMTAAPGEVQPGYYIQQHPDMPSPVLLEEFAAFMGCKQGEAFHLLLELRGTRGR